jgi:hypothetical protein
VLILVKELLERLAMTRQAQPEHQQNTRFLGHEIIGDHKTVRGLLWRDNHASGGGAGGEHVVNALKCE